MAGLGARIGDAAARRRPPGGRGPPRRRLRPHRRGPLRPGARARTRRLRRARPRSRRARHGADPRRAPLAGDRPRELPPRLELLPPQPGAGLLLLLFLAQAMADENLPTPHRRSPSSPRARRRCATSRCRYPEKATVLGPARVIPRELPGVTCRLLDVDAARPSSGRAGLPGARPAPSRGDDAARRPRRPGARGPLRHAGRHRRRAARRASASSSSSRPRRCRPPPRRRCARAASA